MQSFYRVVYLRAWQILKNNWRLGFFGLFVATLGLTGDFDAIVNLQNSDIISTTLTNWLDIFKNITAVNFSWEMLPNLFLFIGALIMLAIVLVLAIASQGALINASAQANSKKVLATGSLFDDLQIGVDKFWPLLSLNLLNKLVSFVFIAGVIVPIVYLLSLSQTESAMTVIIKIFLFFVIVPVTVIVSFVTRYGYSYIILKKQSAPKALANAWTLFRFNWILSLENALAMLGFTILYTIALIAASAFLITPFLILGYLVFQVSYLGFVVLVVTGSICFIALLISAISFFGAYYTIVWTETFLHLTSKKASLSKIHRLAARHLPRLVE